MNLFNFIRKYWHFIAIIFCAALLSFTNYKEGTYLSGWDNLQTELYPSLGVKRALFSIWEEYQSFGLMAGMAHSADLVRASIVWMLSFILPNYIIRYFFNMTMVAVAGIGMLKLLTFTGFSKEKKVFALLGALFYILNFGAVQMMFLPYEAFSVFFGMLPWEIWIFLKIISSESTTRKSWIMFLLINLLSTPQSYTQQLFLVYIMVLGLLSLGKIVKNRKLITLKNSILAFALILAVNSFWILPQIYCLKTSGKTVEQAKINQLATENIWYNNKNKGDIKNFLTFTGFYYDTLDNEQNPIFFPWKQHRENEAVKIVVYILSGIYILGFLYKSGNRIPFGIVYIFIAVALLNNTPPFSFISDSLRSNLFLSQVFRSPFTRFSIVYALVASYFFSCGACLIWSYFQKIDKRNLALTGLALILGCLIIFQSLPAFQGKYISAKMKVKIPNDYFLAIDYFKTIDKNKRIALLPEPTFWGWFKNTWDYDGSGFLWYGIEQPIVSRTFDVWSNKSESYYWEVKNALESEDIGLFTKVLEKYNIDFLIYDRSLLPVGSNIKAIQYNRIDAMIAKNSYLTLEKKWGLLSIYQIKHFKKIADFVEVSKSLPNIGPNIKLTNNDSAYQAYGDYQTNSRKPYNLYYPFLDLTTQTKLDNKQWAISESYTSWYLNRNLPFSPKNSGRKTENITVNLYKNGEVISYLMPISILVENNKIMVEFPKIQIDSFDLAKTNIENCIKRKGSIESYLDHDKHLIVTAKKGATACFSYEDLYLDQKYGYIAKIENKNLEGQAFFFYILDKTKDQAYVEDRLTNNLSYYIIGPKYNYGAGYAFSLQNTSYSNIPSINQLNSVSVYLMPYDEIKKIALTENEITTIKTQSESEFTARKINYYTYLVSLNSNSAKDRYVILNQSFDSGWKAYETNFQFSIFNFQLAQAFPFLFGKEIKDHVLVNNWANGWSLENSEFKIQNSKFVIVYLPQYLEYLGFLLLASTFLFLIVKLDKKD